MKTESGTVWLQEESTIDLFVSVCVCVCLLPNVWVIYFSGLGSKVEAF